MACAHAGHIGQGRKAQGKLWLFEDMEPDPVDRARGGGLRGQRGAELGLSAGSLQKNHEPARHPKGQSAPVILLDQ